MLNADALAGQEGDLLSHNVFAYCENNVVNNYDPSGFKKMTVENGGGISSPYIPPSTYDGRKIKTNTDKQIDAANNIPEKLSNETYKEGYKALGIVSDSYGFYLPFYTGPVIDVIISIDLNHYINNGFNTGFADGFCKDSFNITTGLLSAGIGGIVAGPVGMVVGYIFQKNIAGPKTLNYFSNKDIKLEPRNSTGYGQSIIIDIKNNYN